MAPTPPVQLIVKLEVVIFDEERTGCVGGGLDVVTNNVLDGVEPPAFVAVMITLY